MRAVVQRLLELEFDAAHFSIPWGDVTAEEVRGLQILQEERDRYWHEQAQEEENRRRIEQIQRQAMR